MRVSDLLLFGPPLVMGGVGWLLVWLSTRAARIQRERQNRPGAAE